MIDSVRERFVMSQVKIDLEPSRRAARSFGEQPHHDTRCPSASLLGPGNRERQHLPGIGYRPPATNYKLPIRQASRPATSP